MNEFAKSRTVTAIDPRSVENWNSLIANFNNADFFHTAEWATVIAKTYKYRPCYIVEKLAGELRAVLPLFEVSSVLTGKRGISLPFTDAVSALVDDQQTYERIYKHALGEAEKNRWRYLECRGDFTLLRDAVPSTKFFRHTLHIDRSEASIFAGFSEATRRAIRKSEKSDLVVDITTSSKAVEEFYGLLEITRRRHGVPPQPISFFLNIQRQVLDRGLGVVVLSRLKGKAVAGVVFMFFRKNAIYKFGASNELGQNIRANNLVMWRAIQYCLARGIQSIDLGRTSLNNDGLRRFKLGWGTQEDFVSNTHYELRTHRYISINDASSGWYNVFFKHSPLPLSRALGRFLYPHIA